MTTSWLVLLATSTYFKRNMHFSFLSYIEVCELFNPFLSDHLCTPQLPPFWTSCLYTTILCLFPWDKHCFAFLMLFGNIYQHPSLATLNVYLPFPSEGSKQDRWKIKSTFDISSDAIRQNIRLIMTSTRCLRLGRARKFKGGICCGSHLAVTYGGRLLYLRIFS